MRAHVEMFIRTCVFLHFCFRLYGYRRVGRVLVSSAMARFVASRSDTTTVSAQQSHGKLKTSVDATGTLPRSQAHGLGCAGLGWAQPLTSTALRVAADVACCSQCCMLQPMLRLQPMLQPMSHVAADAATDVACCNQCRMLQPCLVTRNCCNHECECMHV